MTTAAIDKAFKTRWTATGLDLVITGGIHQSEKAQSSTYDFPYATYEKPSDVAVSQVGASLRVRRASINVKVFDKTPDLAEAEAEAIEGAFLRSDRAHTNPFRLQVTGSSVQNVNANPNTAKQIADAMFECTVPIVIDYCIPMTAVPA